MKCPKCHSDNTNTARFCSDCGTSLTSAVEAQPSFTKTLETPVEKLTRGTLFAGRYEIIEQLGQGGMGSVYRVEDTRINEEIALKLIKPEISSDKKTIERFHNELKLTRKIRHKNVSGMFDLGEEKGTYYITMEYVSGQDLKSLIRQTGRLAIPTAISITKQICEGLKEAHNLGIVHRDLKSSNIMIDKAGNARIMDFGIARSSKSKGLTGPSVAIGTPEYMSPEQAEAKAIDHRSDIYSLGVILFEMVTGQLPFRGDSPLSIAIKHKSERPLDPQEINAQIPESLNLLILKCLAKAKEERYQTADQILNRLGEIEKSFPAPTRDISTQSTQKSRDFTVTLNFKKLWIPSLIIIILVVAGMILWGPRLKKGMIPSSPDKPTIAVVYFENVTGEAALDKWRRGFALLLMHDLTQSQYIDVLRGDELVTILQELNQLDAISYSSDVLREIASRGNCTHVLSGNYILDGEKLRINTDLIDAATGNTISTEHIEGVGVDIMFDLVDELTPRIKKGLELSAEQIASDTDLMIAQITTPIPEALDFYQRGWRARWEGTGGYFEAMEQAIELDPEFAMAYRSLSQTFYNQRNTSKGREYMRKAFEFRHRASEAEQYQIEGDYYGRFEKDYDKAIEAYKKVLNLDPDSSLANGNLGFNLILIEDWDEAILRLEQERQKGTKSRVSHSNLARAYMGKGMYENAKDVLESYINIFGEYSGPHWRLADVNMCLGKYDLAFIEINKSIDLTYASYQDLWTLGNVQLCMGKLNEAEQEYLKLLNLEGFPTRTRTDELVAKTYGSESLHSLHLIRGQFGNARIHEKKGIDLTREIGHLEWNAKFLLYSAYSNLRTGNFDDALADSLFAFDVARSDENRYWQERSLHYTGIITLSKGELGKAVEIANELKDLIDSGYNRKAVRFYDHLIGLIHLAKGELSDAKDSFEKAINNLHSQYFLLNSAIRSNDQALFLDSLAFVFFDMGEVVRAQEVYDRITSLTLGRLHYGDIYAKSFYMLGRIYEQQGETTKAIEHYDKFLTLWKDSDPGQAEVQDARERVTELRRTLYNS